MDRRDIPSAPSSAGRPSITAALIEALLEPGGWALAAVIDRIEPNETLVRWRAGTTSIGAGELAAAAWELAQEVALAGQAQPDARACGVEIAGDVVCGHAECEHADGRCLGCLVDLGFGERHTFEEVLAFRYADPVVYLGGGRFHLIEDCAVESGGHLAERDGRLPLTMAVSEAVARRCTRCPECGLSYGGSPRALRLKLALALLPEHL